MTEKTEAGRRPRAAQAIAIPLAGLTIMWITTLSASYADLMMRMNDCSSSTQINCMMYGQTVQPSTYIMLVGIAALCLASMFGKKLADSAGESRFATASKGFTIVAIIASLITAVFIAFAVFMQHLNQGGNAESALVSLLGTYLPIVLYAVLVLFVVLQAFVWKKGDHDDE